MNIVNQTNEFAARRLPPARSFSEATAMVEAALGQLRNAEVALEKQLNSLSRYIDANHVAAPAAVAREASH